MRFELQRTAVNQFGTFGVLVFPDFIPRVVTLEDVWLGNQRYVSCIPTGDYVCRRVKSPKFGNVFEICDVPDRSKILFHAGNWAGTVGERDGHTTGCVLLGMSYGYLQSQLSWGIYNSRRALNAFHNFTADIERFDLSVLEN